MSMEQFLNLPGVNVLSSPDDHVLETADDLGIAVGVDHCLIAEGIEGIDGPFSYYISYRMI